MRLLVTGAWNATEQQYAQLRSMGHTVLFQPQESETLVCPYTEVEGVIGNALFLYHPISAFTNLRYIQLTSAGYDRVPLEYIREHNICLHNAMDVYSVPMAEFAIGGVLQILKQSVFFRDNQQAHRWEKHRRLGELAGRTVAIIGCGSVGMACAKRFSAFDCHVIGVDIRDVQSDYFTEVFSFTQINTVLQNSDIVLLTLPLTEQTRRLFDVDRLRCCRRGAILVNLSRGGLLVEADLLKVLREGHISGAVLDVFMQEPLPADSPLWDMENVLVTPHNSFVGEGNSDRLFACIVNNLQNG